MLDLKPKKAEKKLQPVQAYSVLYYNQKPILRSTVNARWADHIIAHPKDAAKAGPNIAFRNAILKEFLDKETDKVKAMEDRRRDHPEEFPDTDDDDDDAEEDSDVDGDGDDLDPKEVKRQAQAVAYHEYVRLWHWLAQYANMSSFRAQRGVAKSITYMLEQLEIETGLVGTVLLGGPEPKRGGKIIVLR